MGEFLVGLFLSACWFTIGCSVGYSRGFNAAIATQGRILIKWFQTAGSEIERLARIALAESIFGRRFPRG